MLSASEDWRDVHHTASDGTKLYARDYGPKDSKLTPALCLSGLTRTSREFHVIASHLSRERRVICPDYRGRGKSEFASDPGTYTPFVEMADVVGLLDELRIRKAVVIGTSRGGLIAMLMAAMHRPRLAGVVLNDIGPKIEPAGLLRILPLVGLTGKFSTWPDAIAALKTSNPGFDEMSEDEWDYFARFTFVERDGFVINDHDPKLAVTLPTKEQVVSDEMPNLWPMFAALNGLPVGIVRGENSDFLTQATAAKMGQIIQGRRLVHIANRGHTPFLTEPDAVRIIEGRLAEADRSLAWKREHG